MKEPKKSPKQATYTAECGAPHSGCSNTWPGTCDLAAGHDGPHHCDKCGSSF
jgi:hypothetical protein